MPRDPSDALAGALDAGATPTTGPALVSYLGGRAEAKRFLSGLQGPPKAGQFADPDALAAARRRWSAASRQVQRWDPRSAETQQRRTPRLPPAQRAAAQRTASERKRDQMARNGMRIRLRGEVLIPSAGKRDDKRVRTMPAGGAGVYLPPDVAREILDALSQDDTEAAGELWEAFSIAYGGGSAAFPDSILESVEWLRIWPEGSPEPD